MSVLGLTNGEQLTGPSREPQSLAEAESALTGAPQALGYKPTAPLWGYGAFRNGLAFAQIFQDIEQLMLHPHVTTVYNTYKGAIHHADFNVRANSPEVQRFVEIMIQRFWERSLDQAQHCYDYGWGGYEIAYRNEGGYLTYSHIDDFSPFDVWVLTENHHYRGMSVANVPNQQGKVQLWGPRRWPAKALWLTHNRRWHRWYGRSQFLGAYLPWRRLAAQDGAEEVIDGGWYRFAFQGPEIRFPSKSFRKPGCAGGIDWKSAKDVARQFSEAAKAGMSYCLPGDWDEIAGQYQWQVKWDKSPIALTGMLDVVKYLKDEISLGIGVPPELLEADSPGGGWSGRKIPLIGFYTTQLKNARAILSALRVQILDGLVHWNFGPKAKYEVEVQLKVPDVLSPSEQTGQQLGQQGGGQGPAGGAEPPPGAGPAIPGTGGQPVQFSTGFDADMVSSGGALLPFEIHPAEQAAAKPVSQEHWGDVVANQASHLRIVGPTKSGKTTIAEAIATTLPGKLFVIDPLWAPGNWGGLPAATVSAEGSFEPIEKAIAGLQEEVKRRQGLLQQGQKDFERLTIIWDEVPLCVSEIKEAGDFIRRLANFGRHVDVHLIGIGQSATVGSWGIPGYGDTAENFATLYLGNKAIHVVAGLAGAARPAVLEWQGEYKVLDLSSIMKMAQQKIDPSRAFRLPSNDLFAGVELATKTGAGHWITIGGKKDGDGKRHGGSPVYVEGGRITKGAPALHGRKLGALKEEAQGSTHRKELHAAKSYGKAVWAKKARKEGIEPKHLHQLAADMQTHHKAFADDRVAMLKQARKALGEFSGQAKNIHLHQGKDEIKGGDEVGNDLAEQYPHLFSGREGAGDQLLAMLHEGNPEPLSEDDAYQQAFDHLQANPQTEAEPWDDDPNRMLEFAAHGLFGEAKHPRDHGKFSKSAYHAIEPCDLGHVHGYPVRRLDEDTFRMETPTGHVTGTPEDVHAHIQELKGREDRAKPMIDAAIARADAAPELNPFQHQAELDEESKAFDKLPHGAQVVALEPHVRGRLGQIVRTTENGRRLNRVKLHGSAEWHTGRVEPLDPAHSWLAKREGKPKESRPKQGLLFSTNGTDWQPLELGLLDAVAAPFRAVVSGYQALLDRLRNEPEEDQFNGQPDIQRFLQGGWITVNSSNVAAGRYLPGEMALEVEFHGGRDEPAFYRYENVSPDLAVKFAKARSPGRFIWDEFRQRGSVFGWNPDHPYTFISGPSTYEPAWMKTEESRAAHGAIGPEGE